MRVAKIAMLNMPNEGAEPAWWLIRESLRDYYQVPTELPPELVTLVWKLDAIEGNYLSRPTSEEAFGRQCLSTSSAQGPC